MDFAGLQGMISPGQLRAAQDWQRSRKKKGKGKTTAPPKAKPVDPVEAMLNAYFQPQLTGIEAERQKRQAYNARLMRDLGGFTTAVMGMLGQIPGMIRQPYESGAQAMQGLGTGYGAALNADTALDASQANSVLQTIGAPEGQMLSGGDPGGVLAGLAGWLPSQMMQAQGSALGTAAEALPKTASVQAQIDMHHLLEQAREDDSGFSTEVLKVLQEMPSARMELKTKLADQKAKEDYNNARIRQADEKARVTQLKNERDWHMKQAYLALAQGDRKRYNAQLQLAQQKEDRMRLGSAGLDVTGAPKPGYHREGGQVVKDGWKLGPNGQPVKIEKPKIASSKTSTSSKVPGTPAYNADAIKSVGKARKDVDATIKKSFFRKPDPTKGDDLLGGDVRTVDYAEAAKQLWEQFSYLGTTPASKKRLRAMIANALTAAGFKQSSPPSKKPSVPGRGD